MRIIALIIALLLPCSLAADTASFEKRAYGSMPYRLFIPKSYDRARSYPLVVWLHGGAGRGRDNERQISEGNTLGATIWTAPANQARFPSFVVAPQCPEHQTWTTAVLTNVVALVKEIQRTYSIDPRRIYVAGQSMGGYAVWALITEYPNLFCRGSADLRRGRRGEGGADQQCAGLGIPR